MQIKISKDMYQKEAITKAAYYFSDDFYFSLDIDDKYYIVNVEAKSNKQFKEKEFVNEVLVQTTRYNIMMQTKNIRELIIGRALASTIIDDADTGFTDDESIDSEKILNNWFDVYDNN